MHELKTPGSAAELAAEMGAAGGAGRRIEVGGAFSKARWGGPVGDADVRISTAKMGRVLEYEPRDLTISVEAGMPYGELTALLASNAQMIPLDPPYEKSATVGGVLAANHSGPRRRLYGTGRDVVIGMQFATVSGKLVQSGGMVVKNVAGLDMAKLMIGSWGTLAAIATVNFKLIPREKVTRTFLQTFATAGEALGERNRILQSVLQPAAVDLLNPAAASEMGRTGWILAVGTGGSQALVDRYSRELGSAEALEGEPERAFWSVVEGFAERFLAAHAGGAVVKCATTLQEMRAAVENHAGPVVARAANGVAYLFYEVAPKEMGKADGAWPAAGAHLVMEAGPAERDGLTMWPQPGSDFGVLEKIKAMLDPGHLLNKGRYYGRI
jgi:glycolate oxidase FAD binding subunit